MATPVPIVWGTDAVHGHNNVMGATLFPHNIGLGAADNPALAQEIGVATARAVRASGIAWTFAPTLAVVRDARWGRAYEGFSEDPARVARLGGATVQGLQQGLASGHGVLATAKHYIGDGGTEAGVDQGLTHATASELFTLHGAGYKAALAQGVQTVMASFHSWVDTDPATAKTHEQGRMHGNRYLLTDVLKNQLGFDGVVVSDWNGIAQVPGCKNTACAAAINAGIDMVMVPDDWQDFITHTVAQVQAGQIPMARIDDAVRRILRVKLRAGLFDRRPSQAPGAGDPAALRAPELARRAVRETLVLLKNNANVLPLARQTRVLLVGRGAHSVAMQSGGWSLSWQGTDHGNDDFPGGRTVLDGLRAAGVDVVHSEAAQGVDVKSFGAVIAVLGEAPYAEGNGDIPASGTLRHSSRHPEDLAVLQRVAGQGVPVLTVLLSGRVLHVNDLLNLSDAFVAAWLPGSEGGTGLADLLMRAPDGSVAFDFKGRLPYSWPRAACQAPLHAGSTPYDPLFALGYGLRVADRSTVGALDTRSPAGGCGALGELRVFQQAPVPPYGLVVGSLKRLVPGAEAWPDEAVPTDPGVTLLAPEKAPAVRVSTVQIHTQQDAKRVSWLKPARLVAWSLQRAALTAYPDAALVFDVLLHQAPLKPVTLAMECVAPCTGALDLTPLLQRLVLNTPHTVKVPVACFVARGLDATRVDVPFSFIADAPFSAAFARIRVLAGAGKDADALRCSDLPAAR
jgi:beta-glucosidase